MPFTVLDASSYPQGQQTSQAKRTEGEAVTIGGLSARDAAAGRTSNGRVVAVTRTVKWWSSEKPVEYKRPVFEWKPVECGRPVSDTGTTRGYKGPVEPVATPSCNSGRIFRGGHHRRAVPRCVTLRAALESAELRQAWFPDELRAWLPGFRLVRHLSGHR